MKKGFVFFWALLFYRMVFADVQIKYNGGSNYSLIERTDLRRYDNGKYTGLVSREVRSFIAETENDDGSVLYDGNFFVDEATKRNMVSVNDGLNEAIPSEFKILKDGSLIMITDNGYPSFRSFPTYTDKKISSGDKWQAKATRAVDPLNKGIVTKMPIYVEYCYQSDSTVEGEEVFVLTAQWATRYGAKFYLDFGGDSDLLEAQGSHKATIYVSKKTGQALVIRDVVDEYFVYSDGNKIAFKGSIALFTKFPPAVDREKLLPSLQRVASLNGTVAGSGMDDGYGTVAGSGMDDGYGTGAGSGMDDGYGTDMGSGMDDGYGTVTDTGIDGSYGTGVSEGQSSGSDRHNSLEEKIPAADLAALTLPDNNSDVLPPVTVEETSAGIKLSLRLQFKSDSAELLNDEKSRLDAIADCMKASGAAMFLVEGHTASTGNEKGEMELSKDRAHAIAFELSKRGIDSGCFVVKGSGSHKPVAENSTKAGMAKNRRVEITILE
ncbi:MAG: OmpA family protein [Treponema sp.]|nr:OmpA family protein [Candidatus Treponema merdequi]